MRTSGDTVSRARAGKNGTTLADTPGGSIARRFRPAGPGRLSAARRRPARPGVAVHTDPVPAFIPAIPLVDGSRAQREIAFTPRYTLEDGVREMVDFFRREG